MESDYCFYNYCNIYIDLGFVNRFVSPIIGPIAKNIKINSDEIKSCILLKKSMLTMVIEKPMQLTIVRAVPLSFFGALFATKVENRGESATTTIPQKIKKLINKYIFK